MKVLHSIVPAFSKAKAVQNANGELPEREATSIRIHSVAMVGEHVTVNGILKANAIGNDGIVFLVSQDTMLF